MVLLRLGVLFRALGQLVQFFGNLSERAGRLDDLANGALQFVEKTIEQLDHGADFVVRFDIHAPGQVAVAASDGLQRGDDAAHVGHHAADHQPGSGTDHHDQHQAQDDAEAGCPLVGLAGFSQGLLEVLIGAGTEVGRKFLRLAQVAGHAVEIRAQIVEGGTAVDQFRRGAQGVLGVGFHRTAPTVERLPTLWLAAQQRSQCPLLGIYLAQRIAGLVENARFPRCHRIVQQARNARELKDHCIGFFQRRVALGFQHHQSRVGRRQLQRGVADVEDQPEQRDGRHQRQLRGQREILEHASTPRRAADTTRCEPIAKCHLSGKL